MSKETSSWLNNNVLIGNTDQRGKAWHYKASEQGSEPNHYGGAIPVEDVRRRLFNFKFAERPLFVTGVGTDNPRNASDFAVVPNRKAIVADDTNEVLGVFSQGYTIHQYDQWLIENVANLLNGHLVISSAGLLRNRGVAWVEISVPESITTPEGVTFRPNLVAGTSADGTLASVYKRTSTCTVCDNTFSAALASDGEVFKVKHSSLSIGRLSDACQALSLVVDQADVFAAQVAVLCAQPVSEPQWKRLLDKLVPISVDLSKRAGTIADNKRTKLSTLWATDERVSPWRNTAWGVVQAYNTFDSHLANVKGTNRIERSLLNGLTGKQAEADTHVLKELALILA